MVGVKPCCKGNNGDLGVKELHKAGTSLQNVSDHQQVVLSWKNLDISNSVNSKPYSYWADVQDPATGNGYD